MDGEGDRGDDKESCEHPCDFGQEGYGAAGTKGRLAGPPKSRSNVYVFAPLEEHCSDEQKAN